MQPFTQPRQLEPRAVAVLALKAAALLLAVASIVLGALRMAPTETYVLLLAVGLLALSLAAVLDTRVIIPRYLQPPPVPRPRRKKRR